MFVDTTTQVIIAELSFYDTSNCRVYPLIQEDNSNKPSESSHPTFSPHTDKSSKHLQPLRTPSFPHTGNSNKPSQPSHPPLCTHRINAANHHRHYIHLPALTRVTPINHHNHHIHRSALTGSMQQTIREITYTFLPSHR